MRIQLSDHFDYRRLIRFVLPSILMIICTSIYTIVDGFFVSNFVGKTPFAALNLIMPVLMGVATLGFMFGTGGCAIVAKTRGEGREERANQYFTMLVWSAIVTGALISVVCFAFTPQIARALGAEGALLEYCIVYGRILFCAMPAFILQYAFQTFLVAAEKPALSLKITVTAGVINAVLDYLLIVVFPLGLAGAAFATAAGQLVGGIAPLIYFARKNNSPLRLVRTDFHLRVFAQACVNGSSEMVTNLSASIIGIVYNFRLMALAGENGVAAYGVIMYVNIIFMAIYWGYSMGSAPIVSYHYGAENHKELKSLFRKSIVLMVASGAGLTFLSELLARPLVMIFASYDRELLEMTVHGFRLYALAFLVMGVNVWASAFFTALNNGLVSAVLSFARTFVFQLLALVALPYFLGINGIWLAIAAAELVSLAVTAIFLTAQNRRYRYF